MVISYSVLFYQIFFIVTQIVCNNLFGKKGLIVSFLIIILWTLSKTFNQLFILQLLVQSITFIILVVKNSKTINR